MNKVILKGRIGKDWELRTVGDSNSVANTSLATSEKYKDQETTQWHRLVAWGKTAEIVSQYTKKGEEILIEGKVTYRDWEDKEGNKRTSTEIVVERFHFIGSKQVEEKIKQPIKAAAISKNNVDDLPF
jgi:single-strand DNA-binding protein